MACSNAAGRSGLLVAAVCVALTAPLGAGTVRGTVDCPEGCSDKVVLVGSARASEAGETEVLNQIDRTYVPHLLALEAGSTLRLANGDPELHNVHAYLDGKTAFNLAMPFQGMTIDRQLDRPGTYEVRCDVHPEMLAYVVVVEGGSFAVPDAAGRFEIEGVPVGEHTVVLYDPSDGRRVERTVSLETAESVVEVTF